MLHNSPDTLFQLDIFASKVESKYEALKASKSWSGVTCLDSSFNPSTFSSAKPAVPSSSVKVPDPSWQCWFDSKTCDTCGQSHPTKYHDNPGIRICSFQPQFPTKFCRKIFWFILA